jgi:hypothetical protein
MVSLLSFWPRRGPSSAWGSARWAGSSARTRTRTNTFPYDTEAAPCPTRTQELELELELIQPQMAQKPVPQGKIKSSQVYTPQHAKSTGQKSNARALLAQVICLSSSGPKSSWAEETTTPLRGVYGLFTKPVAAPWALNCLKIRSLGRVFSSVSDSHTGLR